ncbi:MAG: hypothetical protein ABWX74_17695 [Aeromicrobium sp.]
MRLKVVGIVIAASVIGGIVVGVAATAMTSDRSSPRAAPTAASASPTVEVPDVEVKEPVFVMNDDGTATLSATVVNHTKKALEINSATNGQPDDYEAPQMLAYGNRESVALEPGIPMRIGGVGDAYRLRLRDRVQVGSTLPVTLILTEHEGPFLDVPEVTFLASVVARAAAQSSVANNGPNPAISVRDAIIVVVPGQAKAYVGGWFDSTIDDMTDLRPTGVGPGGGPIDVLHQTATGGPSGFFAQAGQKSPLGVAPYIDTEPHGDADYVRADDVEVGDRITVTFRFPSGDVVATFKVVQGNPDGTIAS